MAKECGEAAQRQGEAGPDQQQESERGNEGDGLAGQAEELAGMQEADVGAPAAAACGGGLRLPLEHGPIGGGKGEPVTQDDGAAGLG